MNLPLYVTCIKNRILLTKCPFFSLKFPFYLCFYPVLSIFLANVCPVFPYHFVFLFLGGLKKTSKICLNLYHTKQLLNKKTNKHLKYKD